MSEPRNLQPALQFYAAAAAAQFTPRSGMVNWQPFLQFGMSFLNHQTLSNIANKNSINNNCGIGIKNSNKKPNIDHSSLNPTSSSDDSNDDQSKSVGTLRSSFLHAPRSFSYSKKIIF
ncbi:hypothetical protein ACKWTF_007357 [Chironomus riparius]